LSTVQLDPEAQAVGPVQPLPPHWPYLLWAAPPVGAAVVEGTCTVLVVRVVLLLETVVLLVLVLVVLVRVVVTGAAELVAGCVLEPPGRVAEAVEVMADVLWATELAAPAIRAGPGTG